MITDKDIADKRNDVTMLRLQINEHKERRRLDEIEQKSELDDVLPSRNELVDRLESVFALNRQQEDTNDLLRGCIGVLKAELSNSKSAIAMKNGVINEKNKTIDDLGTQLTEKCAIINEITRLRVNEVETREALEADLKASHTNNAALSKALEEANTTLYNAKKVVDGLEAELSARKDDSKVLMQVVETVRQLTDDIGDHTNSQLMEVYCIIRDYLAAPESPVVTLELPSMGTRVVSKNEEALVIDENKMEAVRMLVDGGDNWVVSTDMDAIEVMEQKETIDELKALNKALRVDIDGQDKHIEALKSTVDFGQSRIDLLVEKKSNCIDELMKDLDARNTVIKDFKAIEQKETGRLHETIEGNGKLIDELNDMYCDVCGKLEQIEKIAEHPAYDCCSTAFDEITKIIQEE